MADDDFDLDLDLDSEPQKPPQTTPPAAAEAATAPPTEAPRVIPARRPGLVSRLLAPFRSTLGRIKLPTWNLKTFVAGFIALVVLVVFVENWPPMRLSLLGLYADIPKSLVLVIDFALGFGVAWLVLRRPKTQD